MNDELMSELLELPRGRWMILRPGLPAALSAALGDEYRNHTRIETPEGPLRILRMGRVRVTGRGGSYDVYALCNLRQAPRNPCWDELGRLVVDKDTRLAEMESADNITPMAAWASQAERAETLAELRELKAEREGLLAHATELARQLAEDQKEAHGQIMDTMDQHLDTLNQSLHVSRDLVAMAVRRLEQDDDVLDWTATGRHVVGSLLKSALKAMEGTHG